MARGLRDIQLSRNAMLAIVTVVGIAAIAVVVYFLMADDSAKKKEEKPTSQPSRQAPTLDRLPPGQRAQNSEPSVAYPLPNKGDIVNRSRGFVDAWLRTGLEQAQWLQGVKGYCSSGFTRQLASVDPQDIPAQRRTGEPNMTRQSAGFAAAVVPLDSGTLTLTFRYLNQAWLVDSYDFQLRAP